MRFLSFALCSFLLHLPFAIGAATVPVVFHMFYDENNPSDGSYPVSDLGLNCAIGY